MNKFIKHRKIAMALILALAMIMTMAVTVFAESAGGEGSETLSYWSDPLFFEFIFLVTAFLSVVICSLLIYQAVKNGRQMQEYEDREGTCKLYEDLDDAKWEAPDSVFIDALEPTAAILSDLQPVKPIRGLDGFVITEQPIDPAKAIQMGADPYAYQTPNQVINNVYETVPCTVLEDGLVVPPTNTAEPINTAVSVQSSPIVHITGFDYSAEETEVNAAAMVLEDNVPRVLLEDIPTPAPAPAPTKVADPVTPQVSPIAFVQDVPITI